MIPRLLESLPLSALRRVEHAASLAQGKGWGSGTHHDEVEAALSLLSEGARSNLVAVDAGANVGEWTATLLAAAPYAEVYAFEPSSTAFAVLTQRFSGEGRVRVARSAVGERAGTARLWSDTPGSGLGSLSQRRLEHFGIEFTHSEEVEVITLDAWQRQQSVRPVLLKMDVEGHELSVLKGATALLESVEVVQFEFGGCNIDSRTYFQDFYYFFDANGFRLFRLGPRGLQRLLRYDELDEAFRTTNYFAQRV